MAGNEPRYENEAKIFLGIEVNEKCAACAKDHSARFSANAWNQNSQSSFTQQPVDAAVQPAVRFRLQHAADGNETLPDNCRFRPG